MPKKAPILRCKGFALVEMLAALTILGILLGLSIPAFAKIQQQAQDTQACANLRTLQRALDMAAIDNTAAEIGNLYIPDAYAAYTPQQQAVYDQVKAYLDDTLEKQYLIVIADHAGETGPPSTYSLFYYFPKPYPDTISVVKFPNQPYYRLYDNTIFYFQNPSDNIGRPVYSPAQKPTTS